MKPELLTMSPSERKEFLENHADQIEEGRYFRQFDDEDMDESRRTFTKKSIELDHLEEEYEGVKNGYKLRLKALEKEQRLELKNITQSGEIVDGKQFGFADQVRGVMEYYDQYGQFINSRRLKPNERQLHIHSLNQAQ